MERLIALDTETTGLNPNKGDRVIEIGAVEIIKRQITGKEFQSYINPKKSVGESIKIHGINNQFLKDKPEFINVFTDFYDFIKDATLIIHNAEFDIGFLENEFKLINKNIKIKEICSVIDTHVLAKELFPFSKNNLDALGRKYNIDISAREKYHSALVDAQLLAKVYLQMTGGQINLFNNSSKGNADNNAKFTKIDKKLTDIKVTKANSEELKAHNNYFKS